jgi:RNA polymerase sigma-70 factor (ECF subfamily)
MPRTDDPASNVPGGAARFATTRWSLVRAAGGRRSPETDRALATLCESYWYPLYAHARRRGLDPDSARDAAQGFFARLLEKGDLADADRARGRFRTFLLAAFGHFLSNLRDHDRAARRGGGRAPLPLDFQAGESRFLDEPAAPDVPPDRAFDRQWAVTLLDRALGRLRDEYALAGKADLFDALKPALAGDRATPYAELAPRLGLTEGAVKVAVHRLRARCAERVRAEVAETVGSPDEIEDEIAHLFAALAT